MRKLVIVSAGTSQPSTTRMLGDRIAAASIEQLRELEVPATIGAVLEAADELGAEPANLAVRRATLEDVFLDLTGRALRD